MTNIINVADYIYIYIYNLCLYFFYITLSFISKAYQSLRWRRIHRRF